jgi:hypothetical protein
LTLALLMAFGNQVASIVFGIWMEDSFGLQLGQLGATSIVTRLAGLAGVGCVVAFKENIDERRAVGLGSQPTGLLHLRGDTEHMAHYEETRNYPNATSATCFAAAEKSLPLAGFTVWKTRPIAWLVLARHKEGSQVVSANVSCPVAGRVTLAMGSEQVPQESLRQYAVWIFERLEAQLLAPKGK